MAITNGYTTLAALKLAVGINDTTDDTDLEAAVESGSRHIDDWCGRGRKFWQDATVVARYYYPSQPTVLFVDDISTTTGLVVKVDQDDDGTYETTLTINTDFVVEPVNAAAEYPVRPYTRIRLLSSGQLSEWPFPSSGRASVEVTAKYGWPAVPRNVERACLMQARSVFKAPDTTFGTFALSLDGPVRNIPALHPTARALLEGFERFDPVDDHAWY